MNDYAVSLAGIITGFASMYEGYNLHLTDKSGYGWFLGLGGFIVILSMARITKPKL